MNIYPRRRLSMMFGMHQNLIADFRAAKDKYEQQQHCCPSHILHVSGASFFAVGFFALGSHLVST
jgi:hypothetical protein